MLKRLFLTIALICASVIGTSIHIVAQNPQAQAGQPLIGTNVKYVDGIGFGYWPTADATPFVVDLTPGTHNCLGTLTTYTGGSVIVQASTTNYIYLSPSTCAPAVSQTGFAGFPLAKVVTNSNGIVTNGITDARTMFSTVGASTTTNVQNYGANTSNSDNATNFASALSAAYASGSNPTLVIPGPGTYNFSSLSLTAPIHIQCTNGAALNSIATAHVIDFGTSGLSNTNYQYYPYTVEGCTFIGGANATQGLYFNEYVANIHIYDNTFLSFGNPSAGVYAFYFAGENYYLDFARNYVYNFVTTQMTGAISYLAATPTAGGSGYTQADVGTNLSITTGIGGTVMIAEVNSGSGTGAVTKILSGPARSGYGYSTGTGQATSGGHGTGATVYISAVQTYYTQPYNFMYKIGRASCRERV